MSDLTPIQQENVEIWRPSAAINPERLNYLWTLAERMADSSLVPESLRTEGKGDAKKDLPREKIVANVFAVVEQADRWNISPFALLACAAIVHGKLGFEGKVISSVLKSCFGIDLDYEWSGSGENMSITIRGKKIGSDKVLEITGTVAEWKTTGNGSPWRPTTYAKMLAYRGAREWSRLHEPSAILGVLADDEIQQIGFERQAQLARNVAPSLEGRFGGIKGSEGFDATAETNQNENARQVPMDIIDTDTGEVIEQNTEAQAGTSDRASTTQASRTASAKPPVPGTGGGPGNADASTPAQQNRQHSSTAEPAAHNSLDVGSTPAAGTTDDAPISHPRSFFEEFSGALVRARQMESLPKAKDAFFKGKGIEVNEADKRLLQTIYKAHEDRIKGGLDATQVLTQCRQWIEEDVPEDKL